MQITTWLPSLLTLTGLEIILGIDNVVFIAIVSGRLPAAQQATGRRLGLALALGTRLLLLLALSWILSLTQPVFSLTQLGVPAEWLSRETAEFSWRDLLLIAGGLFLIGKSTYEIHHKLEGAREEHAAPPAARLGWVLVQIALLDVVFSLDSVITAVGMAQQVWVMVAAVVLAMGVMLVFADALSRFIHRHPTLQMLALSFLILIGVLLVADGIEKHIERGYLYFAMLFSLGVELLNLRLRRPGASGKEASAPRPEQTAHASAGGTAEGVRAGRSRAAGC